MAAALAEDLKRAYDRVALARQLGWDCYPWQEDLLRSTSKRILLNCHRQAGKSSVAALIGLHRAFYHPGSLVLCLAPALRQSQELFGKVLHFYRALDRPLEAEAENRLGLELANGSRIITLPGSSDRTVRGFSNVSILIVDEAARVDDSLYFGIRPMLAASDGILMLLSTQNGKRGAFYGEWISSRPWARYEVPATGSPHITEEFLAEERETMEDWRFRQEYECSFEAMEDQALTEAEIQAMFSPDVEYIDFVTRAAELRAEQQGSNLKDLKEEAMS